MIFNSPIFLFAFLPLVLLGTWVMGKRFRNAFLLLASLIFYAWGGVSYSVIILVSILLNYGTGILIARSRNLSPKKWALGLGLTLNLSLLIFFKYAQFLVDTVFDLISAFQTHTDPSPNLKIALPIGISFFTFQAISYLVDLYREEVTVQKNPLKLGLYISLFPQLIAGPIIRYHHLAHQLSRRVQNWEKFAEGVERFVLGLARKVLIANNLAIIADRAFELPSGGLSVLGAWLGIIAYALQIYHDFAGYSDMAIGLGKMLGFDFPENFNFPYIARSVREFWRRWHISLSTWFRDYLYIPLGGNRISASRTLTNLLIVFFLTGLWHGASWNFVIWGLIHGFFMILERIWKNKKFLSIPGLSLIYTWLIVLNSWVFFRADTLTQASQYLMAMWSFAGNEIMGNTELIGPFESFVLVLAVLVSSPILEKVFSLNQRTRKSQNKWSYGIQIIAIWSLLFLCLMFIASDTYNPFIYFRF